MKKTFKQYMEEAKKQPQSGIPPLDKRYGTPQDPRLDIHSDEAYKQSGSGTGIFRAGIGHNPSIYGAMNLPQEPKVPAAANKPHGKAKIKKSVTPLDPVEPRMTLQQIGDKFGLTRSAVDLIAKRALKKLAANLMQNNFRPSDYSQNIKDPTPEERANIIRTGQEIKAGDEKKAKADATRAITGRLTSGERQRQRRLRGQ